MKALLALPVLLLPALAHADQCELVSDAIASRAIAILKDHPTVVAYCQPCRDEAPGEAHRLDHVAKQRDTTGGDDYSVTIDKREVDLAYVYVQTSPFHYENLAALAGCVTSGVSPSLVVKTASDRGIMITASDEPVAPPLVAPAPPPSITYVIQAQDHTWLIAGMCLGTSALWAATTLLVLRRRRALEMKPRAVHL